MTNKQYLTVSFFGSRYPAEFSSKHNQTWTSNVFRITKASGKGFYLDYR